VQWTSFLSEYAFAKDCLTQQGLFDKLQKCKDKGNALRFMSLGWMVQNEARQNEQQHCPDAVCELLMLCGCSRVKWEDH